MRLGTGQSGRGEGRGGEKLIGTLRLGAIKEQRRGEKGPKAQSVAFISFTGGGGGGRGGEGGEGGEVGEGEACANCFSFPFLAQPGV